MSAAPRSAADEQQLASYREANAYLDEGLIRTAVPPDSPSGCRTRREWMSAQLAALGHPERAFGAVHVAGTSGKGSVATMIAELLRLAGVRCGLHVSPYLQVSTEKLWVDGRCASGEQLGELARWIAPHAEAWRGPYTPLHGMAWVAITLEHFRRQAVELAVVEVGVGGRDDLTNVLDTRVAVITSVGLDHLKTLGPTIEHIAQHKAGIIRPGCRAVVLDGVAVPAARRQAALSSAPLRVIGPADFSARRVDGAGSARLDFRGRRLRLADVALGMPGPYQAENAALALAAVEELELDDLTADLAREALARARLPGRAELLPPLAPGGCPVLLDGAHNPDKLAALAQLLASDRRRLHLVYGSLEHRCDDDGLRRLAERCTSFVATEPRVYGKAPRPAAAVAAAVQGVVPVVAVERDARAAVRHAVAAASPDELVVVTGSLYLAGEARGLWYDAEQVLLARTSWP